MARVYVKRMLPAEKEQKRSSHVLLEGVTTESSSTDEGFNNGFDSPHKEDSREGESLEIDRADTLMRIMDLEGVTMSETATDEEPSYVVVQRTPASTGGQTRINRSHPAGGDQRDINYNDEDEVVDIQGLEGQGQGQEGVMHSVKSKVSSNVEQYSNWLQDFALPIIFRRKDNRKDNSQLSHKLRPRSDYVTTATRGGRVDASVSGTTGQLDLATFEFVENIELHHLDGFIFSSQKEKGRGHAFECLQLDSPSWCDKCGDFIWGVYKQCLRCKHCQYTCHHKCRQLVALDCTSLGEDERRKKTETTLGTGPVGSANKKDDADSGYHTGESTLQAAPAPAPTPSERTLTREDLRRRIDAFNNNQHGLLMTLQEETLTFQGFIRVHMNLMRPISMTLPMRPPSIYDVISSDGEGSDDGEVGSEDTLTTSFYLPKDTTKVIHITSSTTTSEVIRALLQKFKITDNPRKFALYEKVTENDKSSMRRMVEDERPLPLCLSWTCDGLDTRRFVLQENDTGEIIWDEFSIPELENFLRILDREEDEYVEQVKARYALLKIQLQKEMDAVVAEEKEKELFDNPEDKSREPPASSGGSDSDSTNLPDTRQPVFV